MSEQDFVLREERAAMVKKLPEGLVYFPSIAKAVSTIKNKPENWPLYYFAPKEVACKSSGEILIDLQFGAFMDALRKHLDKPLAVSSWYRTPEHNLRVSTSGSKGPHTTGAAADLKVHGADALKVVQFALQQGVQRIGVQQRSKHPSPYIHLDMSRNNPPAIWSY